ncbi:MAG: family transcriptional regulator, cyclic receptor protein [Solirubrobacteraceae bacterium]|jgi:CRP-like cAMP-binding protein|nr:Crp/Fnr family transcriptional regulator [Solirubrobacterales bacterium]MEA2214606.1 family transcriptional regulator, cyclic receptor protein [Solirubrobacteraceae bacterium]
MATTAITTPQPAVCRVLELDPGLAEGIPPELHDRAVAECVAREVTIPTGRWRGAPPLNGHRLGIGLLVLAGLLVRRVGIEGRFGAELLGEGDLLRPSDGADEMPTLPMTIGWRVLETARVAILDDAFMGHLADYPQLGGRLVGRAVTRSRNIAVNMAIVHQARVDVRLHMLFWHLAARWGRVGSGGVTVPLRLTHAVLAELVAARRPTVTSALTLLSKRGVVRPTDNGWLLAGESPGELRELARLTGQKAA